MRSLLILVMAAVPAIAQIPTARLNNTTRPASKDFQVGDGFEIMITGAANQPVSVRTTRQGRTDWGPVVGTTDWSGRWSTTGQFEEDDFGGWSEVWTVVGKPANPTLNFSVKAPCLKGGRVFMSSTGAYSAFLSCETAAGLQTFHGPSETDPFRTRDGRVIPGRMRSNEAADQYHAEILQSLITSREQAVESAGQFGDEAGALIMKLIGVNALSEDETRNVLAIIRAAFEIPDRIPQESRNPSETLRLLRNLSDSANSDDLKSQIADAVAYVQAR